MYCCGLKKIFNFIHFQKKNQDNLLSLLTGLLARISLNHFPSIVHSVLRVYNTHNRVCNNHNKIHVFFEYVKRVNILLNLLSIVIELFCRGNCPLFSQRITNNIIKHKFLFNFISHNFK